MASGDVALEALASLISTTLTAHESDWVVRAKPYGFETDKPGRSERDDLMGENLRYCEVLLSEAVEYPGGELDTGAQILVGHRFVVDVFYRYEDSDKTYQSSYDNWLVYMLSDYAGVEGLLYKIDTTATMTATLYNRDAKGKWAFTSSGARTASGSTCVLQLSDQQGARLDQLIPLDESGEEWAHYCSFTVDVY